MANIKDYIMQPVEEVTTEKKSTTKKPSIEYTVTAQSGCDFVITRKTAQTERNCTIIPSQKQYGVYDTKTKEFKAFKNVDALKEFFKDLRSTIKLENVCWINCFEKCDIERMWHFLNDNDMVELIKKGYKVNWRCHALMVSAAVELYKKAPTLLKYYETLYGKDFLYMSEKKSEIRLASFLVDEYGIDIARYFIDKAQQAPMRYDDYYNYSYNSIRQIMTDTGCNKQSVKRWIDYILFEPYRQGYGSIYGFLQEYADTCRMSTSLFGKIKEKYSETLASLHLKYTQLYNVKKTEIQEREMANVLSQDTYTTLSYKNTEYAVVIPKNGQDIIEEGANLSHCVASYVGRVSKGETKIVFMRKVAELEDSLVTIEIRGNSIVQAKGYRDRAVTRKEHDFIEEYAAKKNLSVNNYL